MLIVEQRAGQIFCRTEVVRCRTFGGSRNHTTGNITVLCWKTTSNDLGRLDRITWDIHITTNLHPINEDYVRRRTRTTHVERTRTVLLEYPCRRTYDLAKVTVWKVFNFLCTYDFRSLTCFNQLFFGNNSHLLNHLTFNGHVEVYHLRSAG